MVSTQANTHQTPRRPKSKIRTKRTKRRIGRRIGATSSDSKSSLENAETLIASPLQDNASDDVVVEPVVKKRSLSEERKPCRVKIGQRSSSLQLDATHVSQPSTRLGTSSAAGRRQQQSLPKRKAWFFSWPVRLVVPNRTTIEDEGFDSFHGNNSSSSDCENDENAPPQSHSQSTSLGSLELNGGESEVKVEEKSCDLKYEATKVDSSVCIPNNSHDDVQGNFKC